MSASIAAWMPLVKDLIAILNIVIVPVLLWIVNHLRTGMRRGLATESSVKTLATETESAMQALTEKTQRAQRSQAAKLVEVEHRVEIVKLDLQYRPTRDDFDKLKEQVSTLAGEVHATMRQVEAVAAGVGRIEEFLVLHLAGKTRT